MHAATKSIYLDWNATTPPHRDVVAAMHEAVAVAWANPASVHQPGQRARAYLEHAREAIATLVGFDARDVVLTSGATEANNIALCHPFQDPGSLVVSRIEHPSVVRTAEALAERGIVVCWVDPETSGRVSAAAIFAAIDEATKIAPVKLVSLQAVNHETGVIQPVGEVAEYVHARGSLLHVDAVQAVGKLHPDIWSAADLVSIAAHKMRGPKGIGALAVRPTLRIRPVLRGGAQERGVRPGTQDPVAAAGFAIAAARAQTTPAIYQRLSALRDEMEGALLQAAHTAGFDVVRNGDAQRAPHVFNLSWQGWRGDELAAALDLEGIAVSSGSACSAGTTEPSPVINAMVGPERAASAVRVSLGEETTSDDIAEALQRWTRVLNRGASARPAH